MQVSKWGNSLAVRLPAAVVGALKLKEGDDIEISVDGKRSFEVSKKQSVEEAFAALRKFRGRFSIWPTVLTRRVPLRESAGTPTGNGTGIPKPL